MPKLWWRNDVLLLIARVPLARTRLDINCAPFPFKVLYYILLLGFYGSFALWVPVGASDGALWYLALPSVIWCALLVWQVGEDDHA